VGASESDCVAPPQRFVTQRMYNTGQEPSGRGHAAGDQLYLIGFRLRIQRGFQVAFRWFRGAHKQVSLHRHEHVLAPVMVRSKHTWVRYMHVNDVAGGNRLDSLHSPCCTSQYAYVEFCRANEVIS